MKTLSYFITIIRMALRALVQAQKQKVRADIRFVCFTVLVLAAQLSAVAQKDFTDAEADDIKAFLRTNFADGNSGMVVGILDEHGCRVFSAGKLDNGTDQEVNGDTLFEIGSTTKVFTSLLALEMARRGEIKLDDPVSKYLPERKETNAVELTRQKFLTSTG